MQETKGALAPFFISAIKPAHLRDDALLNQAIAAFRAGCFGDALAATEYVCRQHPSSVPPAILRAKIAQASLPALSAQAWHSAWWRDPENAMLQDEMLASWLAMGARASAASMALSFLPGRCRSNQHAGLIAILQRCMTGVVGACWKSGEQIEGAVFSLCAAGQASAQVVLTLSDGNTGLSVPVPANGEKFRFAPPVQQGVWSLCMAPQSAGSQGGTILQGSPLVFRARQPEGVDQPASRCAAPPPPARARGVNIIIPVYGDLAGTRACIESVLQSLPLNRTACRVIVIDDQSPEPELRALLQTLASAGSIELLRNPVNLGFIESANRGLNHDTQNNALLLNADTLVHGDWVDRLHAALYRASDIASVMPWSNNAETASFPRMSEPAPAPDAAQLASIDTAASTLHAAGQLQDANVPSCCGFAMLMRRSVIARIGVLDGAAYTRGYLEEVDWCLRARAHGLRHMLATGVFVAHAGSTSFGAEKRLRVHQNKQVLITRYPAYYPEHRAFVRADPLAPQRAVLAKELKRTKLDWAQRLRDTGRERPRAVPAALPCACVRIGVWQHRLGAPCASKVLQLARLVATRQIPALRLFIIGEVSEALWHTGVVDALATQATPATTPLTDAQMLGLVNCAVLLTEGAEEAPEGLPSVSIDRGFSPQTWLDQWLATSRANALN